MVALGEDPPRAIAKRRDHKIPVRRNNQGRVALDRQVADPAEIKATERRPQEGVVVHNKGPRQGATNLEDRGRPMQRLRGKVRDKHNQRVKETHTMHRRERGAVGAPVLDQAIKIRA